MRSAAKVLLAVAMAMGTAVSPVAGPAQAQPLCGTRAAAAAPRHVLIVMLENRSYGQVIGSSAAPFQNRLASSCGVATSMWAATHTSAANYLAMSAGEYPPSSVAGCNFDACADSRASLYTQLDAAGDSWGAYEESMPHACDTSAAPQYKIGHNPPIFYTRIRKAECRARDVPVADLTARRGAFWRHLEAGALRSVSWITPNPRDDGEAGCGGRCALAAADIWLRKFVELVTASAEYRSGSTVIFVTYDEGAGADETVGEDCTDKAADLSGRRPSCHVPFFVIYPGTAPGTHDRTFFDHYSVTAAIEDFFALPRLAHAGDAQSVSLARHFGLVK